MESTPTVSLRAHAPMLFPFERSADHRDLPAVPTPRRAEAASSTSAGLLMRILDELDYGLMLVNERAKVRFANRVALRECASTHCMRLQDGHVRPRSEREHDAFLKALAAARAGRRSMLSMRTPQALTSVAVVPMAEPSGEAAEPVSLIVLSRKRVCEPLTVEFFAREHRLTAAELSVLCGLCDGVRPAQIARAAGVALSTIRTQIGSIRQKTGAKSIGELVRQVTVLPPIVPVVMV